MAGRTRDSGGSRTAEICVCGLDDLPGVVEQVRPERLISLLPADQQPPTPRGLRASDHLRVLIDDVDEPRDGFTAPAREHVEELVRDRGAALVAAVSSIGEPELSFDFEPFFLPRVL